MKKQIFSLQRVHVMKAIPGRILAYMALCQRVKKSSCNQEENSVKRLNCLPFISSITSEITPQGAIYARFSFLKH